MTSREVPLYAIDSNERDRIHQLFHSVRELHDNTKPWHITSVDFDKGSLHLMSTKLNSEVSTLDTKVEYRVTHEGIARHEVLAHSISSESIVMKQSVDLPFGDSRIELKTNFDITNNIFVYGGKEIKETHRQVAMSINYWSEPNEEEGSHLALHSVYLNPPEKHPTKKKNRSPYYSNTLPSVNFRNIDVLNRDFFVQILKPTFQMPFARADVDGLVISSARHGDQIEFVIDPESVVIHRKNHIQNGPNDIETIIVPRNIDADSLNEKMMGSGWMRADGYSLPLLTNTIQEVS